MIGLSLAESIRDIASGRVRIEDVDVIISCTRVPILETWEGVIKRYKEKFWIGKGISPENSERIFRELLAKKKILQPAVTEKRLPKRGGGWVRSLSELTWNEI